MVVRHNLKMRRVPVDNGCAFCAHEDETQEHLFFFCDFARAMWFASPLQFDVRTLGEGDFLACWKTLREFYDTRGRVEEALQLVAFVLWRIWKCRNTLVFTGVRIQPCDAVALLLTQVDEFNVVNVATTVPAQQPGAPSDSVGVASPGWSSPSPGLVKLNCDGAWVAQTGRGGVGWVLRDGIGCFISAGGCGDMRCTSALMAEAEAVREALTWCLELGFDKVAVESDSLSLIKMLNKEDVVDLEIEGILFDVHCLSHRAPHVEFLYAPRKCNQAAHKVAAYAFRIGGRHSWDIVCPEWLFNCLAHDVNCSICI
ncbi:hypothetical protein L3X38_014354 [Prunus dulcis]|uniref:RNase H type-1 domain-containing protein n=1 Tax=Prunus dulcis TaxID=3755 RepID=A0AAD4WN12_PRUDU|nr:hypothetical protein L3X38_014354 [Prunus dulcis]